MKKLIIFLLIILSIRFNNIYGETYTIPLNYQITPTYTITMPSIVDISDNQVSFNFSVNGDIYYDSYLQIEFDEQVTISNGYITDVVYVSQDKTDFTYNDFSNNSSATVNINHNKLSAGNWTGELKLVISLKEGAN